MAVWGSQRELAHPPRLVLGNLCHVGAGFRRPTVKGVYLVNVEVRDVAVIAEAAGTFGQRPGMNVISPERQKRVLGLDIV